MNATAVSVRNLSKFYRLHWSPRSVLREILTGTVSHQKIQALTDLNFQVKSGETFGVVGNNGAGKTTLLKILAGTAFPTSGEVTLEGRVSALLELGAGFHPDFTGRENIHFTGALMGLTPEEVIAEEDAIVAFSELREFIDKPVKTYSSGMYIRLGFALTTGFNPSILIIDESLAVGDQPFQKKCTDRILEFKERGVTIVFCSHNLYQVKTLCERAIWLREGQEEALGDAVAVVDDYTGHMRIEADQANESSVQSTEGPLPQWSIEKVILKDSSGLIRKSFVNGETMKLEIIANFGPAFQGHPGLHVSILRDDGIIIHTSHTPKEKDLKSLGSGRYLGQLTINKIPLLSGGYRILATACLDSKIPKPEKWHTTHFTVRSQGGDFGVARLEHHWRELK